MTASNLCQQLADNLAQLRAEEGLDQELLGQLKAHSESCQACLELLNKDKALDALFSIPEGPSSAQKSALHMHIASLSETDKTPIPWIWLGAIGAIVAFTIFASWRPRQAAPKKARKTWRQNKGLSNEDMPKERYRDMRG